MDCTQQGSEEAHGPQNYVYDEFAPERQLEQHTRVRILDCSRIGTVHQQRVWPVATPVQSRKESV